LSVSNLLKYYYYYYYYYQNYTVYDLSQGSISIGSTSSHQPATVT